MKRTEDFSELLRAYENMWVALSLDNTRVIDSDKSLERLFKKLGKLRIKDVEFMKVPEFSVSA